MITQSAECFWIPVLPLPDLCKVFSRVGGLDTGNAFGGMPQQLPPCSLSGQHEECGKSWPKEAFTNRSQAWWHRAPMGTVTRATQHRQEQGGEPPAWATLTTWGRFSFLKLKLTIIKELQGVNKLVRKKKKTKQKKHPNPFCTGQAKFWGRYQ